MNLPYTPNKKLLSAHGFAYRYQQPNKLTTRRALCIEIYHQHIMIIVLKKGLTNLSNTITNGLPQIPNRIHALFFDDSH